MGRFLISFFVFVIQCLPLAITQTVSITTDGALKDVRNCASVCIAGPYHQNIIDAVGCGNSQECFCQDRLRAQGSSYLSSCITTEFTTCSDPDYSSAVSIYNRYCGFTGPATVIASVTPTENTDVNDVVTVTTTTTPVYTVIVSSTSIRSTSSECLVLLISTLALYLLSA